MLSNSGYAIHRKGRFKMIGIYVLVFFLFVLSMIGVQYVFSRKKVPILLFGLELVVISALSTLLFVKGDILLGGIAFLVLVIYFLGLIGRVQN